MTRETVDLDALEKPPVIDRKLHSSGPFLPFGLRDGTDVPEFLPIGGMIPVRQTSSTHGPNGFITTDPAEIQASVERLQRKIESQAESISFFDLEEAAGAETLIITYGVTARAARAAVKRAMEDAGKSVSLLVLKTLWPVPENVIAAAARRVSRVLVVEMNLGQMAREVRRVLCGSRVDFLGKMDGRLVFPDEILQEVLRGEPA